MPAFDRHADSYRTTRPRLPDVFEEIERESHAESVESRLHRHPVGGLSLQGRMRLEQLANG
jgi:hypothetical protein